MAIQESNDADLKYSFCFSSTSRVETENSPRYLKRLSTHFSNKIQVEVNENTGRFEFDIGVCFVITSIECMTFICVAENPDDLSDVVQAMQSHFERFAVKENLTLEWT